MANHEWCGRAHMTLLSNMSRSPQVSASLASLFRCRSLLAALLLFGVANHAVAQATWLVGPNGFAQVNSIAPFAQDGDTIEIEPGSYQPFTCNVGLTIRAMLPGTVTIDAAASSGEILLDVPALQTVNLADLSINCRVRVINGRSALTNCEVITQASSVIYVLNATMHLVRCTVRQLGSSSQSWAPALRADQSDVTAVDCVFDGGAPLSFNEGVSLYGSRMHGSGLTIIGDAPSGLGGGLSALHGSKVWLTDSTATSQFSCPLRMWNGGEIFVDNVTLIGSTTGECTAGTAKSMLAVSQPNVLTTGAPFPLNYRGQPNSFLAVFASGRLGTVNWGPLLDQPSWLDEGASFAAALVVTDASGFASVSWPIPNLAGIAGRQLWFKGINGLALPFQASAVAGGVAR